MHKAVAIPLHLRYAKVARWGQNTAIAKQDKIFLIFILLY